MAVWSGDTVRKDEEGFIYFVGRRDEMIKTSGYRVSPTEVEEVAFASGLVAEAAAFGIPDERLGQTIVLIAHSKDGGEPTAELLSYFTQTLPQYMAPKVVMWRAQLPRNANGKIDRALLANELRDSPPGKPSA
jgi:acyl-coenzyme A synthetase/AMP-(fatty) acid ligase